MINLQVQVGNVFVVCGACERILWAPGRWWTGRVPPEEVMEHKCSSSAGSNVQIVAGVNQNRVDFHSLTHNGHRTQIEETAT